MARQVTQTQPRRTVDALYYTFSIPLPPHVSCQTLHIDGLLQESRNTSVLANCVFITLTNRYQVYWFHGVKIKLRTTYITMSNSNKTFSYCSKYAHLSWLRKCTSRCNIINTVTMFVVVINIITLQSICIYCTNSQPKKSAVTVKFYPNRRKILNWKPFDGVQYISSIWFQC